MNFNKNEAPNGSVENFEIDSTCTRKEENGHIINSTSAILNYLNDVKFPHIRPSKKII